MGVYRVFFDVVWMWEGVGIFRVGWLGVSMICYWFRNREGGGVSSRICTYKVWRVEGF